MFSNLVTASQLASSSLALSLSFGELTRYFATTTTTTAPAAAVVVGVIYHVIQLTIATKDDEESFLAQFNQLAARPAQQCTSLRILCPSSLYRSSKPHQVVSLYTAGVKREIDVWSV